MKCPHCGINFHDNWDENSLTRNGGLLSRKGRTNEYWAYRTAICPGPECGGVIAELGDMDNRRVFSDWRRISPIGSFRGPVSQEVPPPIAKDYIEACRVLPVSPKASAALSRRCLQSILHAAGYKGRDLAKEIDLLLEETDPLKGLPLRLRETVDAIRSFGNFSAHPIDDKTSLQVIDVEPEEAEWCLEIIEELFEHFYIGPAQSRAKKAALDAKLAAGGKPPSKSQGLGKKLLNRKNPPA